MRVSVKVSGLGVFDRLEGAVDRGARKGLERHADAIAQRARQHHPYTNRTGQLEASTIAAGEFGDIPRANVVAEMPYASFVEEGTSRARPFPFVQPAVDALADELEPTVEAAIDDAVRRTAGD